MSGVHIAQDGTLIEAFGFIPLAALFFIVSFIAFVVITISAVIKCRKK